MLNLLSLPFTFFQLHHHLKYYFICCFIFCCATFFPQNQTAKWCFGQNAGLDFMTNPPSPISCSMVTQEGCASVASAAGNLLFYTDGSSVWDQTNSVMGNGTSMGGNNSTTQSALIVRQPGSTTIYYIFSLGVTSFLRYSVVDMSLAAGMGSVTVNSAGISSGNTEKLTAVKHCNGTDIWVIVCTYTPGLVNAYLVTAAGVNTTPVASMVPGLTAAALGNLKTSPNGSKIAFANYGNNVQICDFNNSTGIASNVITLSSVTSGGFYGAEFSPDGTKLYSGTSSSPFTLFQWDLCAGSPAAIVASEYSVAAASELWGMQLAPDGKIYIAKFSVPFLSTITNPNGPGPAFTFTDVGVSLGSGLSRLNLPNFMGSEFNPPLPPFTWTTNLALYGCMTASFTAPAIAQTTIPFNCPAQGASVTGVWWDFGDPASGALNTSTLTNPTHAFPALGTYTTKMVYYRTCGVSDTITDIVTIAQPCFTAVSQGIACSALGSATVTPFGTSFTGPLTYTWMPGAQSGSVAAGLSPGTYTVVITDQTTGGVFTLTTTFIPPVAFTGVINNTGALFCNGASTGTANVQLNGGSGAQNYAWISSSGTQTTASATGLSGGIHTLQVIDAVSSCSLTQSFFINQPTAIVIAMSASPPTVCVGGTITLTGLVSGGTPGTGPAYTYSWLPGPAVNTLNVSSSIPGTNIYTLSARDGNNCVKTETIAAGFIAEPLLALSSVSICPLQTGTLTATGAVGYTWTSGQIGNTFADNPLTTTVYTVTGETAGCTSTISGSIILKSVPVVTLSSNSPVCDNQTINFYGSTASGWAWNGPNAFTSSLQNPQINPATQNNNGIYNLTVTAANQCTASSSTGFTINPTPTVSVAGSTVCNTQTATLQSNFPLGASAFWTGPLSFTSALQNPVLTNPPVTASGNYTLLVTSATGCTNSAVTSLTVSAMPTANFTSNSPQCQGGTINFNSAGSSGSTNFSWAGPNGFSSLSPNPGISGITMASAGIYTLTLTHGPCQALFTNQVQINPPPVPVIQSNSPVCETKTLSFSVTTNYVSYQWSGPAGFSATTQTASVSNAALVQSGIYSVLVTDGNLCQGSNSTSVTILPNPVIGVVSASVCFGQPAQLSASGADSYIWSGPGNFTASVNPLNISQALDVLPVIYTVTGKGLNTCTSVATTALSTFTLPVATAEISARVCLNSSVSFSAAGGVQYQWTGPKGFLSAFRNFSVLASDPRMGGTYTLTVTDEKGCKGSATAGLIIDLPPTGNLWASNQKNCVPFCSDYGLTAAGDPIIASSWSVNGLPVSGTSFSYCFNTTGDHQVSGEFRNSRNCTSIQNFVIKAYPVPVADFEYTPKIITEGGEVVFESISKSENLENRTWFFASNEPHTTKYSTASFIFPDAGEYPVALVLKNKWGCEDTVVKILVVEEDFQVFIPNAFTPDDDGLNDSFTIKGRGIRDFSLIIFDRWGEKVYETSDPQAGWDGTFREKLCQTGTYVWQIRVVSVMNKEKLLNGTMLLLR